MSASERITTEVTAWPGVEAGPGERGEFAFRVGRREIGHLHGDRVAHFGFTRTLGERLRREGRVGPHPVFPDKLAWGAREIRGDEDVRAVIELLRLNYDRLAGLQGVRPSAPEPLPFAPDLHIRSFVLARDAGDVLIYDAPGAQAKASRQYLGHWHEAMFPGPASGPVLVHAGDAAETASRVPVRATFSRRHRLGDDLEVIPMPGHTPGSTAFLWEHAGRRILFTADSIYLHDGEWLGALLESSDKTAYLASLALLRDLDFDVLVPWAASAGQPWFALTDRDDARRRIGAIIERISRGETS